MIPAGVERDKVIAELRESYSSEFGANAARKPYSTSIVHAMELWEEMEYEANMACGGQHRFGLDLYREKHTGFILEK